jgi:hypothetical protein
MKTDTGGAPRVAVRVWGIQRLQNAAQKEQVMSVAHTKSPVSRSLGVTGDPWQGGLKERGVRKYLDAVAKVQAGGGMGAGAAVVGVGSPSAAQDDSTDGAKRDEEFEAYMQQLQWQRIGRVTAKLPHAQPDTKQDAEGGLQQASTALRRVVGASSKMTDEEEDAYRQHRRQEEMRALGLDPTVAASDLSRAAAAKISELEQELERLKQQEEEEEEEEHVDARSAAAAVASGAGAWKRRSSKHAAVIDVSSSDDEDGGGVVDDILAHDQQAGQAGLGPDEAARLALELSRLKAQLQDADEGDGEEYPSTYPNGAAVLRGATGGDAKATLATAGVAGAAGVHGVESGNAAADTKAAQGSQGWGSKLKKFFFGKGSGIIAQGQRADQGNGAQGESSTASGMTSEPPSTVMVRPPMATPSVQGNIKLAIKVGGGGRSGGGMHGAGNGSENGAHATPRMMTALPEDADDLHDDSLWLDDDQLNPDAEPAAAARAAAAAQGGAAGQQRAERADGMFQEEEEGGKKRTKQQPAALQIAPAAPPSARSAENMKDAMMEADAMLSTFAPPPRRPVAALKGTAKVPKGTVGSEDHAAVPAIADVEALMMQVKDKLRQIEGGDDDATTFEEVKQLKAQVARALAAMEADGEEARQNANNGGIPNMSTQVRNSIGVRTLNAAPTAHDEDATPRMPERSTSTPRLGSMEAHVTQQRVAAKAPGAVPPMLSSFFETMDEAEPLPPPSQRGEYPDEMDASYDDDKTETMSIMSMATALLDKGELEHRRNARPAPRHQRPVNVSSAITPAVGFSGESPFAYREGGQQNRWLNDNDTPRSHVAASVADSERTEVLASAKARFSSGAVALASAEASAKPVLPGDASSRANGAGEQEAAARGTGPGSARSVDGNNDAHEQQQQKQQQMHRQARKEQLQHLQAKLQAAAAGPKTAASNASFHTEYSDETKSVRSRDLLQTPISERTVSSQPAPGQLAPAHDARDLAARSPDHLIAPPHKAQKAEGAATWAPGDLYEGEHADETWEERRTDAQKRRKQRDAERGAGRRTLGAVPRQRPGTGESGASRSVATEALNQDIFEESEEEHYDEGHAGIVKRQEEVMAQNMALVMGGVGEEGASEWGDLEGGEVQDDVAAALPHKHDRIAPAADGLEDEESGNEEGSDPLLAEMKRKAKLRAKRARALEAGAVVHTDAAGGAQEPAAVPARKRQPEPIEISPRKDTVSDAENVRRDARSQAPHLKSGKADVVRPPSDIEAGREPDKVKVAHRSLDAEEVTPRLSPRALVKRNASQPARPGQDPAAGMLAQKDVVTGQDTTLPDQSSTNLRGRIDADPDPFSPRIPLAAKKQTRDDDVPVLKMPPRPFSASTMTSRSQSDAGGAAQDSPPAHTARADGDHGAGGGACTKRAFASERGMGLASSRSSSDNAGALSDEGKRTGGKAYRENELGLSDSELGEVHSSDLPKAESWIKENEEVSALKKRAAKQVSEEVEVRNYSAILTSQLGFLGPLPSVSLPDNNDSDESTRSRTRKSKHKKDQKAKKHAAPSTPSSGGSLLSEDSFDSAISPSTSARGDSTLVRGTHGRAGEDAAEPSMRASKWRSHDADGESDGRSSSGSDDGLPNGYGKLAPKDLMRKNRQRKKKGAEYSLNYASSGEETVSSSRRHDHGCGSEGADAGRRNGRVGNADEKKGVRYQVRAMPDGTTKRVAVNDNESLFQDHKSEQSNKDVKSEEKVGTARGNARRRHVLDNSHISAQSPGKKREEEDLREKADRLQREARMLREAAEYARQQEALRVAAERERRKAQQQVEELQKQLQDAKSGKTAALHAQMMQMRMATEASGEDELNAYLSRPLNSKVQQPAANVFSGSVEPNGTQGRAHTVKTAPPAPVSSAEGTRAPMALASTLPSRAMATAAVGATDETRWTRAASHEEPESAYRPALTSRSAASVRIDAQADDDWEEEDEDLPPELVQKLESVAASLIQQSWRKQRQRAHSHKRGGSDRQSKARAGPEQLAATWAGPTASYPQSCIAHSDGPAAVRGAATAATGDGMGTGRGRTSTAHTMLGACATGADLVPFTLKALQVAVTRSGLMTPVDTFVWFDRAGKNGLSHAVVAHGLKTLCATNIDPGQLMFDLNPQAPDGRVSADEFVSALHWASSGTKDAFPSGTWSQQVCAARRRLSDINACVEQTLQRSVMSKTMPLPAASSFASSLSSTAVATHSYSDTLAPVADRNDAAQDGEQKKARVLRDARAAFKSRGFHNVAELFVFVESCGGVKQEGQGGAEVVKAEQLLKALKALHLFRESQNARAQQHTHIQTHIQTHTYTHPVFLTQVCGMCV